MTNAIGTAEVIVKIAKQTPKPIVFCFMGIVEVSAGVKHLQENNIPVFKFPESAARALGKLYIATRWLNRQRLAQFELKHDKECAAGIIKSCLEKGQTYLGEFEGLDLLKCYGFHTLPTRLAENESQAVAMAKEMGYPVVMKIVSSQIIHKSDAGGVMVGLKDENEVRAAFPKIIENAKNYNPDAEIDGVLIQEVAASGREVILGMNRYPEHGPLVMFGLGGVFVELFKDVVFRLAPIGRNNARRMVRSIRSFPLLNGFRSKPKTDIEAIHKRLVSLSHLVSDHPEIKELDINPLLIHPEGKGTTVADVRIILSEPDSKR